MHINVETQNTFEFVSSQRSLRNWYRYNSHHAVQSVEVHPIHDQCMFCLTNSISQHDYQILHCLELEM